LGVWNSILVFSAIFFLASVGKTSNSEFQTVENYSKFFQDVHRKVQGLSCNEISAGGLQSNFLMTAHKPPPQKTEDHKEKRGDQDIDNQCPKR
jgi:hypothetical protein